MKRKRTCHCHQDLQRSIKDQKDAFDDFHEWFNNKEISTTLTNYSQDKTEVPFQKVIYNYIKEKTLERKKRRKIHKNHVRFNIFGDCFYTQTKTSPAFAIHRIIEYLG